ncbi:acyl-CoA thioesterase [Lentibacter algarum]|uniref:acyl-CoA thioesterase n=1 Tax=Lentibacter algarum TaxID=576131 RepID=UPI0020910E28|nr:acyl-CoA thioesterase [Lentibacter algarum]
MSEEKPQGEATLRTVAMPADVNVNGDIFGGWVLAQMDIASGIVAAECAQGRVTTVAVDAMKFIRPVQVGDILSVYACLESVGRTSMAVGLEAWALRRLGGELQKVTEGRFTYVAIDAEGRPRPVPQPAPKA